MEQSSHQGNIKPTFMGEDFKHRRFGIGGKIAEWLVGPGRAFCEDVGAGELARFWIDVFEGSEKRVLGVILENASRFRARERPEVFPITFVQTPQDNLGTLQLTVVFAFKLYTDGVFQRVAQSDEGSELENALRRVFACWQGLACAVPFDPNLAVLKEVRIFLDVVGGQFENGIGFAWQIALARRLLGGDILRQPVDSRGKLLAEIPAALRVYCCLPYIEPRRECSPRTISG